MTVEKLSLSSWQEPKNCCKTSRPHQPRNANHILLAVFFTRGNCEWQVFQFSRNLQQFLGVVRQQILCGQLISNLCLSHTTQPPQIQISYLIRFGCYEKTRRRTYGVLQSDWRNRLLADMFLIMLALTSGEDSVSEVKDHFCTDCQHSLTLKAKYIWNRSQFWLQLLKNNQTNNQYMLTRVSMMCDQLKLAWNAHNIPHTRFGSVPVKLLACFSRAVLTTAWETFCVCIIDAKHLLECPDAAVNAVTDIHICYVLT